MNWDKPARKVAINAVLSSINVEIPLRKNSFIKKTYNLTLGESMKIIRDQRAFRVSLLTLATASILGGLATQVAAQTGALEEVIVTAERRSQSLQDVPISITTFNEALINEGNIISMEDVALRTPNFKMTAFNITEPQLFLRGIGNTNDSSGSDPAVAVFIDDVYLGRPSGASTDLYDLERIEVLRGPQGTLYGRNAAGGAINIYTKKPQQEFEAKVGLTAGNYSLGNLRAYVNGPLSDTIAGKFTMNVRKRDGFAKNINTGQELEDEDTKSVRGQLLISASESVDVLLGFDYADIDTSGNNRFLTNLEISDYPGVVTPLYPTYLARSQAANDAIGNNPRKSNHDEEQYSNKEILGLQARVDVDLDWAVLTSITAYRESESEWWQALNPQLSARLGGTGLQEVDDGAEQEAEQWSQELRLAGDTDNLKWVAGLYYFSEEVQRFERFNTWWDPASHLAVLGDGTADFFQNSENDSFAVFGQFTYNVTEALALTFGARYTDDEKSIDNDTAAPVPNSSPVFASGVPLFSPPYSVSASDSWSETTVRASVDYHFTDDHMVYATYSEGFKSGAFNGTQRYPELAAVPIEPELATNYEIGFKTQWMDDRVRINANYFDLDYENLQVWVLTNSVLTASNAQAASDGIEAEVAFVFSDNFKLTGSYATLDAKFTEGSNAGKDLPRAPETSWSVMADLGFPMANGASLDFLATVSYTDEFHFEVDNDPRGLQEDVTIWDASATYTAPNEQWDASLWGKNLSDELYSTHHIDGSYIGATRIFAPPRTYGLSVNFYWK